MERDIRETKVYREVEGFFRSALEPGFGSVTDVSDPEPSPDGREVAYRGEVLEGLEGHPRGRICLAASDGSGWRLVTRGPNDDAEPRWSPDGTRLTFRSDREVEGRFQLYGLQAGAIGEAQKLASVPGVVEHHRWSPDGSRILMVVAGEHAEQADALGSGTLGADRRLPSWIPEVESSDDEDEWRSLWILEAGSEEPRRVSREGLNVWEASWAGNDAVAAVVSDAPGEGAWYRASLALIDLATGEERTLLTSDVQLSWAEGSPDGSRVAVVEALCSDRYVAAGELRIVDVAAGEVRRQHVDGDVSWIRWRGDRLFAMALSGMTSLAFDVDLEAEKASELWRSDEGSTGWYPSGAPVGADAFVTTIGSIARAPEVLMVGADGERTLAATRHPGHDELEAHVGRRERVTWSAPDGLEIEGLLTVPPGEPPFPLVVEVHGGPIGAITDRRPRVPLFLLLSRGYAVLQPNPRGSGGRGRAFAEHVVGDMGGADARDILAGVDAMVARGVADPERIGVAGGSYGGFMAAWLPTIDDRFRAAVALSPVTDWYSEHFNSSLIDWVGDFLAAEPEDPGGEHHARSPAFGGRRLRTPTLLTAGLRDRATPPGQAIEHFRALRIRGVPAEVAVYPEEGHGVRNLPAAIDLCARMVAWFERFMPGSAGGGQPS